MELVRALRSRTATQPEDKAFATYGILRRLGICVPEPNYHRPVSAIYQDLQERILMHYPASINLLVYTGTSSLAAPSWVPDWRTIDQRSWLTQEFIYDPLKSDRASELTDLRHRISNGDLTVHGIWRGKIDVSRGNFPAFDVQRKCSNSSEFIAALQQPAVDLFDWLTAIKKHIPVARAYNNIEDGIRDVGCDMCSQSSIRR